MPRSVLPTLVLLAVALSTPAGSTASERLHSFTGYAFDKRDGRLLYSEQHFQIFVGDALAERLVVYRCPDGRPFARKTVDYREDRLAPAFYLFDQRAGHREGLRRNGEGKQVFVQTRADREEQSAPVAPRPGLVADAGFDEFVRKHWDALEAGESLRFDFLLPFRKDVASFRVRKLRDELIDGVPATTFRLSLSGLLGLFVSSIDASYDREQRRLLRYEGVSNIRDERGNNYLTRILFPLDRHRPLADPAPIEQAREEPLVGSCRS